MKKKNRLHVKSFRKTTQVIKRGREQLEFWIYLGAIKSRTKIRSDANTQGQSYRTERFHLALEGGLSSNSKEKMTTHKEDQGNFDARSALDKKEKCEKERILIKKRRILDANKFAVLVLEIRLKGHQVRNR